jgi:putative chitinase
MILTEQQLAAMIPGNTRVSEWHRALVEILPKYGINTQRRIAHFISQCAHESNNFRTLEENLNYSSEALLRVFPRYFGQGKANPNEYARNPEKIANYVYMDVNRTPRGALGNTQPGDGWRFRGRGLKQLTGRNNYAAFGKTVGMTAEQAADYVATEKGAIESACWFWDTNKLNTIADTDNVVLMTQRINGGDIGLADRLRRYNEAMGILGGSGSTEVYRVGSRGDVVREIQRKLGITADGVFGPGTESTVRRWQSANGLTVNGIVDQTMLRRLLQ